MAGIVYLCDVTVLQAMVEGSRAYDVLKRAPFLVPFTSRVKIFTVSNFLVLFLM